jgi:cytochrome c oxidase subunit I
VTATATATVLVDPPGVTGFIGSVDHKRVGLRYIYTSFFFFFIAGLLALVMRAQLAGPDNHVVDAQRFNELFSMHGTMMIFLFNTPILAGFGNYFLPLMIGAEDMAYPRLNAFSYWVFLLGGTFLCASFVVGRVPDGGWFAYVPLTGSTYSPGLNIDFWGLAVVFLGVSTTVGAVNFIVTAITMRKPGMAMSDMPIFAWSMVVFSAMVLFAVPALTLATGLLELDRIFGTAFFVPELGGNALLFQHLFWFWGHPEVYILFIPATGMVSEIIPKFSRQVLATRLWVVGAMAAIAALSFAVWVHHMFATGLPTVALGAFGIASFLFAIPSGVLFFAWIATMWRGVVELSTAMLFCVGFLLIFLLGGITGVMVSVVPFDWQVHDSYFVVAHFHYVLNGAVVFPIFAAMYYWLPTMTGRVLSERLGKLSFWTMFVGFNVAFFPMHILGFLGMPRRIYTYQGGLGWTGLNQLVSAGSVVFGLGTGLTLLNFLLSRKPASERAANAEAEQSGVPLVTALVLAMVFVGLLVDASVFIAVAIAAAAAAILWWAWHLHGDGETDSARWGMAMVIATEAMIFVILLSSYLYVMAQTKTWPPAGIEAPKLGLITVFSVLLWASSAPVVVGERALERGDTARFRRALTLALVMGAAFVAYSLYEFGELHFGWRDNAYGSLYYTVVGLHLAHVCVGLVMNLYVQAKGRFARVFGMYWHFVDAVWVFVFPTVFLTPHLVR